MLLAQVGNVDFPFFCIFAFSNTFPHPTPIATLAFTPFLPLLSPPLLLSSPSHTFGSIRSRLSPTQTQSVIQLSAFLAQAHPGININRN